MLRRADVTPTKLNLGITLAYCASLLSTAVFSTGVHEEQDNVYSMLACTALVVVVSQASYTGATLLQFLYCAVRRRAPRAPGARASSIVDERSKGPLDGAAFSYFQNTCTLSEVLCNTLDFGNTRGDIRLWISRSHLWHVLYLLPVGVYGAFVSIPVYDPACSVCFALGLFLIAMRVETKRGHLWGRSVARRVVLAIAGAAAFVSFLFACALAYMAMLHNTNVAWASVFNATSLEDAQSNGTLPRSDELLAQYHLWFEYAYPRKTWPWWMLSLVSPCLLTLVPDSMRLPVALETSQLSVTCVALAVLCYASAATERSVFDFIAIQNALGNVYLMFGGVSTWVCIFCIMFCMRQQNFACLPAPLLLVCLAKSARMLDAHHWRGDTYPLFVCAGISLSVYAVALISFCRAESVAVRQGWGAANEVGSEAGSEDSFRMADVDTRFTVQDAPHAGSPRVPATNDRHFGLPESPSARSEVHTPYAGVADAVPAAPFPPVNPSTDATRPLACGRSAQCEAHEKIEPAVQSSPECKST